MTHDDNVNGNYFKDINDNDNQSHSDPVYEVEIMIMNHDDNVNENNFKDINDNDNQSKPYSVYEVRQ